MTRFKLGSTLALLLTAAMSVQAQTFEGPDMGLQVGVTTTQGSLKTATDTSTGYNMSLAMYFQPRRYDIIFRPRITFNQFNSGDKAVFKMSSIEASADLIWYPTGKQPGFYVFAGGGPTRWSVTNMVNGAEASTLTNVRLGVATGFGFEVNHFLGFEVGFHTSEVTNNFRSNALTCDLSFKF